MVGNVRRWGFVVCEEVSCLGLNSVGLFLGQRDEIED